MVFPLLHGDEADIDSVANALSFAALALGLNIVVGMAGLLDLGYAAFFAIGAYFYGVLSSFQLQPEWSSFWEPFAWLGLVARMPGPGTVDVVHTTLSFWLADPAGGRAGGRLRHRVRGADAAAAGRLPGDRDARLRRDRADRGAQLDRADQRRGGAERRGAAEYCGDSASAVDSTPYYYVAVALVAGLIFVSSRLRDSRVGRAWMAIRDDEIAAGAMGVNLVRFKLLAFAIGASFAGMTGVFYVAKLQTATPEMFGFPVSVMILVMVVLGGMGSVWGVVLGAMILQLLQSWFLQDLTGVDPRARDADRAGRSAEGGPGAVDRADLRHHPGADDAVSARRADPGASQGRRADLRAAARRGGAGVRRDLARHRAAGAARRAAAGDRGRDGAVRRAGGAERAGPDDPRRRGAGGDRAERVAASRRCST